MTVVPWGWYEGTMVETRTRVLNWFVRGGVVVRQGGERVLVDVDPVVVGRDEGAHVRFDDPEVSALHCELRATTEGIVLKDLGSTNGTFIGKVRVREVLLGEKTGLGGFADTPEARELKEQTEEMTREAVAGLKGEPAV